MGQIVKAKAQLGNLPMKVFEITIQRKSGDGWPVVVEWRQSGIYLHSRFEGMLHLDQVELIGQTTPLAYGTMLGNALFRDGVRDAFIRARSGSDDDLRVLLFIEADDLKTLRWERLCAPIDGRWDFLALDQRTPFSLFLPSLTDRRFPPIGRRDLRALVLVSNPKGLEAYDLAPFDDTAMLAGIRAALGNIQVDVLGTVPEAVGPPTLNKLCQQITAEHYTLLHIVAHGRYRKDSGDTLLYLAKDTIPEGNEDQVDPVPGEQLISELGRLRGARGLPHFTFLSTCESARPEAEGALGGLAQRLVRELGMPAVVAMTDKVSIPTAQALAKHFYARLRQHGEVDRALGEAYAGLIGHYDITVPALYSRLGGRPLFSDTLDRALTNREIEFGLSGLAELIDERAPILRPDFQEQATRLLGTVGPDEAGLSRTAQNERQTTLDDLNELCEEVADLSFNALALGQEPPAYDRRVPFRGLYAFRSEDQEFFFGREALVKRLIGQWEKYNFLAVLGPSGSGKSSLVLAGLIPALKAQTPALQLAYTTPGSEPVVRLKASLAKISAPPVVLVVDQFEELFTLCPDEARRRAFLNLLLRLARRIKVVLTMRADFWGECAPYRQLKEIMQAHQELIAPMDAAELRRAMEQQAAAVGLRFEADLSHTIVADVRGEPGAMPLLQHALLELWQRRHGRWLRAKEYRAIGGVQQAIARTADSFYESLCQDEQDRARDIFVRLTRLDEEAVQGEEWRDTRRRVGAEELVPVGSDPAETKRLVQRMADARLVVTSMDDALGREEVEVVHEALIRYWPRLRGWLSDDRTTLRLREGLRQAALEWNRRREDDSYLMHRGGRLEEVEELFRQGKFTLNELEQAYFTACVAWREAEKAKAEEQHRRELEAAQRLASEAEARQKAEAEQRQEAEARAQDQTRATGCLRRLVVVLSVVFLLAVGAAALAIQQTNKEIAARATAEAEQAKAERQTRLATSRQLTAEALNLIGSNPEQAVVRALKAISATRKMGEPVESEAINVLYRAVQASRAVQTLCGHAGVIRDVAYSSDSKLLASAGVDGVVNIWDTSTSYSSTSLPRGDSLPTGVTFDEDDSHIIVTDAIGWVEVWDLNSQAMVAPYPIMVHDGEILDLAQSLDGKLLATTGRDQTIQVINLSTGKTINSDAFSLKSQGCGVSFNHDGSRLVAGDLGGNIYLWNLTTDGLERPPFLHNDKQKSPFTCAVAFSPDGQIMATGGADLQVRLWSVENGELITALPGHSDTIVRITFSPDGELLASAALDGTANIYDIQSEELLHTMAGHSGQVRALAFSADGQKLATGSADATVKIWNTSFLYHSAPIQSITFSKNGSYLVSASDDGIVRIWDTKTKRRLLNLNTNTSLRDVAIHPEQTQLATIDKNGLVEIWEIDRAVSAGKLLKTLKHDSFMNGGVAYSPDGQFLAAAGDVGVAMWKIDSWRQLKFIPTSSPNYDVVFHPHGSSVAVASLDKSASIFDVGSGGLVRSFSHVPMVDISRVSFSPDGSQLATAGEDGKIIIWDTDTGKLLDEIPGHTSSVIDVAYHPTGSFLVTGSADKTVKVWDLAKNNNEVLAMMAFELKDATKEVRSVVFSPDGKQIATASGDQLIRLYPLSLQDLLNEARQRITQPIAECR